MNPQHLSDEAIVAFADGVLGVHARERASRHAADCPECAHAVATQREAIWALRTAPAPCLPTALFDRLRAVPATTPPPPGGGSPLTPSGPHGFGAIGAAAFVPGPRSRVTRHVGPIVAGAAAVAVAGVIVVSSVVGGSSGASSHQPSRVSPVVDRNGPALNQGAAPLGH